MGSHRKWWVVGFYEPNQPLLSCGNIPILMVNWGPRNHGLKTDRQQLYRQKQKAWFLPLCSYRSKTYMLTLYENLMRGNQLCHWWIASVRDFDPSKGFPSEPKASIRKPPGLWTEGGLKHQVAASAERVPELVKPMLKMSFLTEIAKIKPIEWVHPAMPSYRKETFFFWLHRNPGLQFQYHLVNRCGTPSDSVSRNNVGELHILLDRISIPASQYVSK